MKRHTDGTDSQEGRNLGVSIECRREPGRGQGERGMPVFSQQLNGRLGLESERALER
jgi:hypothetical protein